MGDIFIRPETRCSCGKRGAWTALIHSVLLEFISGCNNSNVLPDLWIRSLQFIDRINSFSEQRLCPECATAGYRTVFTIDILRFDRRCYFLTILQLKSCDIGSSVKDKWLEMAAILLDVRFDNETSRRVVRIDGKMKLFTTTYPTRSTPTSLSSFKHNDFPIPMLFS